MQRRSTMAPTVSPRLQPVAVFVTLLLMTAVAGWLATARATAIGVALPLSSPSAKDGAKSPAVPHETGQQPILVGHVTWQGRPAQPNNIQSLPLTLTLELSGTAFLYLDLTTDASGFFTVTLGSLPPGTYNWWVKGPQYLANTGIVSLSGAPSTSAEMGTLEVGDASADNLIDIADFGIVRASFGKSMGDTGYDQRADFSGDNTVDIVDFSLMRGNFGGYGPDAPPNATLPDPSIVAPPLDTTVATDIGTSTEFLYSGPSPIQTGVISGTIEITRVAVLRGKVLTRSEQPLSGVTIEVLDHPEYGSTLSRADGMFDMAVNGGGLLTVSYSKEGHLPAQRDVQVPWTNYEWAPDVVLIPLDPSVTSIDLSAPVPMQVAHGSVMSDTDGVRQATLMFPLGTTAVMTLPSGMTQILTILHVRATEYTVGSTGPQAMPGELPSNSGYTYAPEFSVDEATSAGASGIGFSQQVVSYQENFIGFPVGTIVPSGYYDRETAEWVASANGLVVSIVSITDGRADLDISGNGTPATPKELAALGITDAERDRLGELYTAGQSLWRVPLYHFSPWDYNFPRGPKTEAIAPNTPDPASNGNETDKENKCDGSIIGCQRQTLGEVVEVAGTGFNLYYISDRVPGRRNNYAMQIPITLGSLPESLAQVSVEVSVAGQVVRSTYTPTLNQTATFEWDGKDAYGRTLQGQQPVTVRLSYSYPAIFLAPAEFGPAFARFSGTGTAISGFRSSQVHLSRRWQGYIGGWDARQQGLGGWSLDAHNAYDTVSSVLYHGDGERRSAQAMVHTVITTSAGTGINGYSGDGGPAVDARLTFPYSVAVAPNGVLYVADRGNERVRRIGTDGIITTYAGTGTQGYNGDGIPANQAQLRNPSGLDIGPDGSLYIADAGNNRIRRVGPDGIISTIAGNGSEGFSGDGGPATQAQLYGPHDVAIGPDGSLYIVDSNNKLIRRVGTDGIITTIAGGGTTVIGEGIPAARLRLLSTGGIEVGPDGSIYISESINPRVRRIGPDGKVFTFAGNGNTGYNGDGILATQASVSAVGMDVGPDGSLYIADAGNERIRRVGPDGIITTVAGSGTSGYNGDNIPSTSAHLRQPHDVAIAPDGRLYVAEVFNHRLRRIGSTLPEGSISDFLLPSEDGSEVYIFNSAGRHLRTLDALTSALRYQFAYSSRGRLITITDGDNNVTIIERDDDGNPTGILSPYGQRTTLSLDPNGYLSSITNPANEAVGLSYTTSGLLTVMTDTRGGIHSFAYDSLGRLTRDESPDGGVKTLSRVDGSDVYTVTLTTLMTGTTTYSTKFRVGRLPNGDFHQVITSPSGQEMEFTRRSDGTEVSVYADGMVMTRTLGPDPRWGMTAPIVKSLSVRMPSGLTTNVTSNRTVVLGTPGDPFSLLSQTDTLILNGRTSTSTYDAATRTITGATAAGRQASVILNAQGYVTQAQVAGLDPVTLGYDVRGRVISATLGTGGSARTSSVLYDSAGYVGTITDPISSTLQFGYDAIGRVLTQTVQDGRQIFFTYDSNSNLTSLTPPGRPPHDFTYTPTDLQEDYIPPEVGAGTNLTHYTYNLDKQLAQVARPDGQSINLAYDNSGRLDTAIYPHGATTATYDSATGQLTQLAAPGGVTTAYGFDGSLPITDTWSGPVSGSMEYSYDNSFRVVTQTVNGANPINYGYDQDDLLTSAGVLTLTHNPQNSLLTGTELDSITDTLSYNSFAEVERYSAASSGSNLFNTQYAHDTLGRITVLTETVGGTTNVYSYTYDLAERLTDVHRNGVMSAHYAYDANDNRLNVMRPAGTITATYDLQDRLLTYGPNVYSYTANGELLSKVSSPSLLDKQKPSDPTSTTSYSYDVLGNLRAVTLPEGAQVEYVIDGQNRRIGKKVNGALVQGFLYQGELAPVAELDGSKNVVSRFVYGTRSNMPDYVVKSGVTYRILTDHLGSPRLIVNSMTGQVVQRMDYDEFGDVLTDTNPGFQPFGFAGGLYDQHTKLTRFGARDYDAETGRWTAKDPIGLAGGVNVYSYVGADPVNYIDPTGLFPSLGSMVNKVQTALDITGLIPVVGEVADALNVAISLACGNYADAALSAAAMVPGAGNAATVGKWFGKSKSRSNNPIKGYAKDPKGERHSLHQAIGRDGGVGAHPKAMLDAVRNPNKVIPQGRGRTKYEGQNAVVVLDANRRVVTTWATSRKGWRSSR